MERGWHFKGTLKMAAKLSVTMLFQSEAGFPQREFVLAMRSKNKNSGTYWLAKNFANLSTNHLVEFLFSPSGKRA